MPSAPWTHFCQRPSGTRPRGELKRTARNVSVLAPCLREAQEGIGILEKALLAPLAPPPPLPLTRRGNRTRAATHAYPTNQRRTVPERQTPAPTASCRARSNRPRVSGAHLLVLGAKDTAALSTSLRPPSPSRAERRYRINNRRQDQCDRNRRL